MKYKNHIAHYQADAEVCDYFDEDVFDQQMNRRRYESFRAIHTFKDGERVLEIGSGGGPGLQIFGKLPVVYFPLDIPLKNLKKIKQGAEFPLHPLSGDVFNLPLYDNCVDVVILSEVLEHLEKPLPALGEIKRVLKPNGELLVSVPYKEKIAYNLCVHCNQPTPQNAHFHSFDKKNMTEMLAASGLNPQKILTINNKIAHRLRLNVLLKGLPYPVWRLFDWIVNLISRKASHMVALVKKV